MKKNQETSDKVVQNFKRPQSTFDSKGPKKVNNTQRKEGRKEGHSLDSRDSHSQVSCAQLVASE